jgi:hypothetical protein
MDGRSVALIPFLLLLLLLIVFLILIIILILLFIGRYSDNEVPIARGNVIF